MSKSSAAFQRIVLILAAAGTFGVAAWVGYDLFQPATAPFVAPSRARVSFDTRYDVRNNPLFTQLQPNVIGDIQTGPLGKANPFLGKGEETGSPVGGASNLPVIEQVQLGGGTLAGLERSVNGGVMAYLIGKPSEKSYSAELREYAADGSATTFASWTMDADHPEIMPVSFSQAPDGTVWLGGATGMIGTVAKGEQPLWTQQAEPIVPKEIRFDGAGRLWMTDYENVLMKDQSSVQQFGLSALGGEEELAVIQPWISLLSASLQKDFTSPIDQRTDMSSVNVLSPLADGRMSVNNGFYVAVFPVMQGASMQIVNPVASSSLALAVAPNGDVWSRRIFDDALVRVWATSTQTYVDPVTIPHDAIRRPWLFASDDASFYAIDYTPKSSILWRVIGSSWVANVVMASGTLPVDSITAVRTDNAGNLWAAMKQGGLLKITHPSTGQ
jgi:hypothetical protein